MKARVMMLCGCLSLALACCAEDNAPALPSGTAMLPSDSAKFFSLSTKDGVAKSEITAVQGQPFAQAVRVTTGKPPPLTYDVQLSAATIAPIEKDDVLLATFYLRCEASKNESGEAATELIVEGNSAPFDKLCTFPCSVGPVWQKYQIPFTALQAFAAGKAQVNFRLGYANQSIDIGGVELVNYKKEVKLQALPKTKITYAGREKDAPWRKSAAERIEKIRKGDLNLVITGADGKPISGAQVSVALSKHLFAFGSAVAAPMINSKTADGEKYRETVKKLFNRVVEENALKWPGWQNVKSRPNTLKSIQWLRDNGLEVRGHCLVWPSWKNSPSSAKALMGDPAALRRHVHEHIVEEVTALRGQLCEWDVINEPFDNFDILKILGDSCMVEWFKAARENDPDARLFINDYSILSGGGLNTSHQDHYEKTIRYLIDNGAPLDGIGMQSHFGWHLTPPPKLLEVLDRYAVFGKIIQSTEFDINITDEQLQADYMRDFMTTLFSHKAVSGIVMWGFWEGRHWLPQSALFRKDWSVKPCGQVWMDLVQKEWTTRAELKTDAAGTCQVRGFLGDYDVTVTSGGKTKKSTVKLTSRSGAHTISLD